MGALRLLVFMGGSQLPMKLIEAQAQQETASQPRTLKEKDGECALAADCWNGASDDFSTLPPPSNADTEGKCANDQNASFVGLENPAETATVDCAVATCQFESKKPDVCLEGECHKTTDNNS
ncbi:hypothetical protein ACSSS7_002498 [Eimeria intestinalis]